MLKQKGNEKRIKKMSKGALTVTGQWVPILAISIKQMIQFTKDGLVLLLGNPSIIVIPLCLIALGLMLLYWRYLSSILLAWYDELVSLKEGTVNDGGKTHD